MQVKSPMLISVGMYLPLETTFAIFVGGLIKGIVEMINEKRLYNAAQKARIENVGILIAAGLIAGEALTGLAFTPFRIAGYNLTQSLYDPSVLIGLVIIVIIALGLIYIPIRKAGKPDDPAPPPVSM